MLDGEYSPERHAEFSFDVRDHLEAMDSPEAILGDSIEFGLEPEDRLVNVAAVWDRMEAEGWPAKVPTVGEAPGYGPLLYPGLNSVAGGSGAAKSWLSQILVAGELRSGPVVVLDAETGDKPEDYLSRLRDIQVSRAHARNLVLIEWVTGVVPDALPARLGGRSARLLVADSMPEAMAALNLDENSARDVAAWQQNFRRQSHAALGPEGALLTIDGLPKGWAPGQDVRGAVGSARKLYGVETFWRVYPVVKGSRTVDGYSDLVCTKDRNGNHAEGATVAEVFYGPSGFGLREPRKAAKREKDREGMRDKVLSLLEAKKATEPRDDNPQRADIERIGKGAFDALDQLVSEGIVSSHKIATGRRGGQPLGYFIEGVL